MISVFICVASLLANLAVVFVVWMFTLRMGLRWAKVPDASTRQVVQALGLMFITQIVIYFLPYLTDISDPVGRPLVEWLSSLFGVLSNIVVIAWLFRTSLGRAIQVWIATLVTNVLVVALGFLVIRPFVVETFVTTGNSMAPTLVGRHWQGTCDVCGGPTYCTPQPIGSRPQAICRERFHVAETNSRADRVFGGDRLAVVKFRRPQRWDIVTFRCPDTPSTTYIFRVVGLPGEEVVVREGEVWIDGQRARPPETLRGLTYDAPPLSDGIFWASPDLPAQLADDEYFVLGDFAQNARDSRFWEVGAPGHKPFAVPRSHLQGVAAFTYWPPSRWRLFL